MSKQSNLARIVGGIMWARFDKRTKQVIPCSMMEASLACSRENNSLLLEQAGPCRGTTYAEAVMNHAQLVLKYTEVIRA